MTDWIQNHWLLTLIASIATVIGAVLSPFGIAKLLELYVGYKLKQREIKDQIHESNQAKMIDLDQEAFKTFHADMVELKKEVKEIRAELNSQMQKNIKLETENEMLKKDNERLKQELLLVQERELALTNAVNLLQERIKQLEGTK